MMMCGSKTTIQTDIQHQMFQEQAFLKILGHSRPLFPDFRFFNAVDIT